MHRASRGSEVDEPSLIRKRLLVKLAAMASCDYRTAQKWVTGRGVVRPLVAGRLEGALERLGFKDANPEPGSSSGKASDER